MWQCSIQNMLSVMISWFDSYIDKSIGWLYSQFYRVYSIMIHVVWFCFALLWLTHLLLDKMSTILLDAWRCSTTHSETEGFSLLSPHTVLYSWGRWTHSTRSMCCGKAEGSQRLSLQRGLDGKVPRTLIISPFKTNVRHAPADNLPISVCNSLIPVKTTGVSAIDRIYISKSLIHIILMYDAKSNVGVLNVKLI